MSENEVKELAMQAGIEFYASVGVNTIVRCATLDDLVRLVRLAQQQDKTGNE